MTFLVSFSLLLPCLFLILKGNNETILSDQKYVIMPIYVNLLGLAMMVSIKPTAANIAFAQAGQTIKLQHFIAIVLQLIGLTSS